LPLCRGGVPARTLESLRLYEERIQTFTQPPRTPL
jgi:hypothetical protein